MTDPKQPGCRASRAIREKKPQAFKEKMAIPYGERIMGPIEGLPKSTHAPAKAGDSGTMIDEPAASGWL